MSDTIDPAAVETAGPEVSSDSLVQSWNRAPHSARIRLVLAMLATVMLLPYAWGRTFLILMMTGRSEPQYAGLVVAGIVLVIALTFRLAANFPGRNIALKIGVVVAALWTAVVAAIVLLRAGTIVPVYPVAALFVPATAWLVWIAWMFFAPIRWITRVGVLVVFLALILPFVMIFRVDGLTGAAQVDFNYRHAPRRAESENWSRNTLAARSLNLNATGKNEFTQFGGPNRNAVLSGVKLARDWTKQPPKLLWRANVGEGWSGFAVVRDTALTQEQRGEDECVVCRDLHTGNELWVHADATRYDSAMGGNGPRGTPAVDNGFVYAIGAKGLLNCIDGATGKEVWQVDILKDNNAGSIYHGVCASPMVLGENVLVCPTGSDGLSLAAYNKHDGSRVWAQGKARASYSSPMLVELDGVSQILLFNSDGLSSHDANTGDILWHFPWHNGEGIAASQPVLIPGKPNEILVTTGYGKGSTLLRAGRNSGGTWNEPEPLWDARTMKTKFTTAVAFQDHVYGLDDGILQCIELTKGQSKWKAGRYGHGQLLLVDDLLLIQTEAGDVVLAEANPTKLVELARLPALTGKTWNNPALAGPYLLTRNDHEAVCYELPVVE